MTELTPEKMAEMLEKIPKPEVEYIKLLDIQDVVLPHPYCIGTKHVGFASDRHHGMLGAEAIRDAEEHGVACETCKQRNRARGDKILSYDEHVSQRTLFIGVPQNKDLNKVEGLHSYLLKIKDVAESMGITGFAFLVK